VVLATLPAPATSPAPSRAAPSVARAQLGVLASRTLWLFGASYFFIKLVRYALLFWLPYYLATARGYSTQTAANVSIAFDAGGIVGVVLIGRIADRSRRLSRQALSALWISLLVPALWLYSRVGLGGVWVDVLVLVLLGALLFGPDSLIAGAAAQDAADPAAAAMATGFVNGLGSFGAVLQGLVVGPIGVQALFPALALFALGAVVALVPTLRATKPPSAA
jgi:OPA family glycerol-3-phosphate transporter-like MFS transporter 1/2